MHKTFPLRFCVLLVPAMLLNACAGMPEAREPAASSHPLARMSVPVDDTESRAMSQLLQAEFALADGDTSSAARAYAQAAATSRDVRVAEASASLAMQTGNPAEAQSAIDRMQATGADPLALARERARLALLRGHRDEARAQLQKVLAPGDDKAWRSFARLLAEARDPALAGTLLEELANARTLPPDRSDMWVAMSQLGEKLNRHIYAEQLADEAASRFGDARAYAWAAHLKMAAGQETEGLAQYARAVADDPDNVRLRLIYAAALSQADRNRDALKVLRAGPQTLDTLIGQAAYAARLDDQGEIARVYAELVKHRTQYDRNIDFLLGQLAETLDKPRQALDYYRAVPQSDEHAFEAVVRQAVLLDQSGDKTRAHALAAGLQRDYADDKDSLQRAFLLDAQLYVLDGRQDQAVATYSRGLEKLPDDTDLLYGRALSEADRGNTKAAIADLRKVLELKPGDVDAMNALGYTLADENRNLEEADTLLRRALEHKPDEPAIIDSWGWLKYRQGDLAAAEKALRKAWDMRKDPDIGVHLGEVLWHQGRREEARKVFAEVRKDDPHNAALAKTLKRLEK